MARNFIKSKDAIFFAKVKWQSMIDAGIDNNDLLLIDRSLENAKNKITILF